MCVGRIELTRRSQRRHSRLALPVTARAHARLSQDFATRVYAAYGPGTKVLLSVLDAATWAAKRAEWVNTTGFDDPAPLAYIFSHDANSALAVTESPHQEKTSARGVYARSPAALETAYLANLALLSCVVAPEDLLVVDLSRESADAPKLWAKIANFVGRADLLPRVNTSRFPYDQPGVCRASEIERCRSYPAKLLEDHPLDWMKRFMNEWDIADCILPLCDAPSR